MQEGFYVVPQEETHDAHTEADGQMNLFGSFAMQNSGEEAGSRRRQKAVISRIFRTCSCMW